MVVLSLWTGLSGSLTNGGGKKKRKVTAAAKKGVSVYRTYELEDSEDSDLEDSTSEEEEEWDGTD